MMNAMEPFAMVISFLVAFFVGRSVYRVLFEDADEFWECVGYSFMPDLFSLFRGELFKDMEKTFKVNLFTLLTVLAGGLTYLGVLKGLEAILSA